jgi:hypothetical protein
MIFSLQVKVGTLFWLSCFSFIFLLNILFQFWSSCIW